MRVGDASAQAESAGPGTAALTSSRRRAAHSAASTITQSPESKRTCADLAGLTTTPYARAASEACALMR